MCIDHFNKKIATKWQDKTSRSKADLERFLYLGSAAILGRYIVNTVNLFLAVPAANAAYKGLIDMARPKSTKHEEIQSEVIGLPGKIRKYLNVILYGSGVVETLVEVGYLVVGAVSENNELYMDSVNKL